MRIIILIVFLLLSACGGEREKTFLWNGTHWPVVVGTEQMVNRIADGKSAAIRFRLSTYKETIRLLGEAGRKRKLKISDKINSDLLVCSSCRRLLSPKEVFDMLLSGDGGKEKCPACSSEYFMLFTVKSGH